MIALARRLIRRLVGITNPVTADFSEGPVSKTEIQAAIDQHHHCGEGIRYQFKTAWAAFEPRWSTRSRRYIVAIDVLSEAQSGSSRIHIVAHARTTRADLLRLVDDALEDHLASGCSFSAVATPAMVSVPHARQS